MLHSQLMPNSSTCTGSFIPPYRTPRARTLSNPTLQLRKRRLCSLRSLSCKGKTSRDLAQVCILQNLYSPFCETQLNYSATTLTEILTMRTQDWLMGLMVQLTLLLTQYRKKQGPHRGTRPKSLGSHWATAMYQTCINLGALCDSLERRQLVVGEMRLLWGTEPTDQDGSTSLTWLEDAFQICDWGSLGKTASDWLCYVLQAGTLQYSGS